MQALGTVNELLAHSNLTQIKSPRLSESALAQISSIIDAEHGETKLTVETPRQRLEDYFLEVVEQAHAAELETSGAKLSSGVSDFLTSDVEPESKSKTVIEQLVAGREHDEVAGTAETSTESAQTVPVAPAPESQRREMIDSLVDTAKDAASAMIPAETDQELQKERLPEKSSQAAEITEISGPEGDTGQVDQGVINDLLKGADQRTDSQVQGEKLPGE